MTGRTNQITMWGEFSKMERCQTLVVRAGQSKPKAQKETEEASDRSLV